MNSRSDKYYDEGNMSASRTSRNSSLYKEINKTELDNFEVRSNATVIGNSRDNSIDIDKIKSILDTHYNDIPKRRTIHLDEEEYTQNKVEHKDVLETKEYDINVILDKAKDGKVESYQEERAKKLRDTQFDILNNLDIDPKDYIEDYDGDGDGSLVEEALTGERKANDELEKLINTITLNEKDFANEKKKLDEKKEESNEDSEFDIFSDLKGSENTVILEGLQEKTEQLMKEFNEKTADKELGKTENEDVDTSFFTKSSKFKDSDFDDFKDVESSGGGVVKTIIAILVIIFIIGIVILVKSLM